MGFYNHINYSLGNEDWNVEAQALRVAPGNRAICITASGDRPLHLLMTDCAEVVSVDKSHAQNFLLELKINAITHLDYEKYLKFLGCETTPHRLDIYRELRPHLSKSAATFWDRHQYMVKRGIIYQGRTERFTYLASRFFKLLRHSKIQKLFSFTDIEKQREYVAAEWDTKTWRALFNIFLHPKISRFLIVNDPGLNAYIDYPQHPGVYLISRIRRYLDNHLAVKSPLLQLLLKGTINHEAYFPYLTLAGYTKIRARPERLTFFCDNVIDFLSTQESHSIDCFSLSDIASYMPQDAFEKLLHAMHASARHGARFCLREFISQRRIPEKFIGILHRDKHLEEKLEIEETNFVYRFMAGEIHKLSG
jgi:S-adenosylmethionine-diacylglycerol 3-amino-3-carboxypropyl transferase